MNFEFNPEKGTYYLRLREGEVEYSDPVYDGEGTTISIIVDRDIDGEVLGVEILV